MTVASIVLDVRVVNVDLTTTCDDYSARDDFSALIEQAAKFIQAIGSSMLTRALVISFLFSLMATTIGFGQGYRPAVDRYNPDRDLPNRYPLDGDGFIIESGEIQAPMQSPQATNRAPDGVFHPGLDSGSGSKSWDSEGPAVNARQNNGAAWNIESVLQQIDHETSNPNQPAGAESVWWTQHVVQPVNSQARPVHVNVGDLILMAMEHSATINVARALPQIRETAITGAAAEFDWNQYIDARYVDTSEPVGNILTVGGGADRFREHDFSIDAGFRRKFFNGADFYTYQRLGHVNSNSTFFQPNNQATSRIVLGFTQPLLRGKGEVYNTSLILLAEIDTGSAADEFQRQLQSHLLEVARGYWALYLERTNLAQRVNLFLKTHEIATRLNSRANIDAKQSQVISANAALESRKSDLIRSRAAVKNAETRLRALINSPMLSEADMVEMIPAEHPSTFAYPTENYIEFETALQNRPEISAALKAVRAGSIRLQMSDHEILPTLNLVTEAYVSGLRGESDIGDAWLDQFREGEPSYSVGFQYEIPIGRRAAFSNLQRRQVEVRQLQEQYRSTLELIRAEIEIAVRELQTSYSELHAKHRGLKAAEAEARTLAARWNDLGDQGGTGGLLLESLLRAQERVTEFEYEFASAQMTYSLALINLRHANGTLLQTQANVATDHSNQQFSNEPNYISPEFIEQPAVPSYDPSMGVQHQQHYPLLQTATPSNRLGHAGSTTDSPGNQLQQATANWQNDPRYEQRSRPFSNQAGGPTTGRPANGQPPGSGLSYRELIGLPGAAQAASENDWRKSLR